jgi:hypothetical protein
MTEHRVRISVTVDGFAASCCCGWRCCRRTREQRDTDVNAHELANALASSEDVTD